MYISVQQALAVDADVTPINKVIRRLGEKSAARIIEVGSCFVYGDGSTVRNFFHRDGIHVNDRGTKFMVMAIHNVVEICKMRGGNSDKHYGHSQNNRGSFQRQMGASYQGHRHMYCENCYRTNHFTYQCKLQRHQGHNDKHSSTPVCTQNKYDFLNLICENCNTINQNCKCENICTSKRSSFSIENNYSFLNLEDSEFDNKISVSCSNLLMHKTPSAVRSSKCTGNQSNDTSSKNKHNMTQNIVSNTITSNQPRNACPTITGNRILEQNDTFSFHTIGSLNFQHIHISFD